MGRWHAAGEAEGRDRGAAAGWPGCRRRRTGLGRFVLDREAVESRLVFMLTSLFMLRSLYESYKVV
ncbi:unnamed protein product [Chondrus crispus]|uniref:Uncharacterized protein n=1 Tax=Chondrus crispus TaxID=2769 RepID=R7QF78_CHOCR|nr:unnamed protein product [Chondrus crispus]CDF36060.1 unnamed protein product [Chondrus crispus]|eukprot:XP_005715879.1 unnamed protein product [Chondrus crispus]